VGYVLEGDIYAVGKKWPEAIAAYRRGLRQVDTTDLASRLHSALFTSGSATNAEEFAAKWLKDHPKGDGFRLYLAEAAMARRDYATATQHYRKVLDTQPNNAVVLNNLAWTSAQLKDPKAIEHAEQANKLAPDQPAIMDTLGTLLLAKGDTARGLELLRKASAMAPQAANIRLNLAKGLIKAGQNEAAKKELDELAKLGDKFSAHAEVTQLKQGL
jgi:putative PEP-CTERM system TPR-repeat lipoprotein